MSRLGFDRATGFVYEGREDPAYPVWPAPVVSQATLIESPSDHQLVPGSLESNPFTWLFREDSFDPVSRVRRGRLFMPLHRSDAEVSFVEVHPAVRSDQIKAVNNGGRLNKRLSVFIECSELLQKAFRGEGMHLAIGVRDAYLLWRIIQSEITASKDVLVTLRAESAFGVLPGLNKSAIPPESLPAVEAALARVLDAAFKELPTSLVDQCRNAAKVIASHWMCQQTGSNAQEEKDLGPCIKAIQAHFGDREKTALRSAMEVIRVLHPRGKDHEAARLGLRPVEEGDAEYCVHAVGFILREVGWAK